MIINILISILIYFIIGSFICGLIWVEEGGEANVFAIFSILLWPFSILFLFGTFCKNRLKDKKGLNIEDHLID